MYFLTPMDVISISLNSYLKEWNEVNPAVPWGRPFYAELLIFSEIFKRDLFLFRKKTIDLYCLCLILLNSLEYQRFINYYPNQPNWD